MIFDTELLRTLQKKDYELLEITASLEEIPIRKRDREVIIEEAQEYITKCEEALKEKQRQGDAADLELKDIESRLEKLLVQRNTSKSNSEMAAFNHQIAVLNEKKSEFETVVLKALEASDASRTDLKNSRLKLEEAKKEYAAFAVEMDQKYKEIAGVLEKEKAVKIELLARLDSMISERYERILAHTGDTAIAEVENGTCLGCDIYLPPNVANSVMARKDLVTCHNCQRILILSEEEAAKYC